MTICFTGTLNLLINTKDQIQYDVNTLDLRENGICGLHDDDFASYSELEKLFLDDNELKDNIEQATFRVSEIKMEINVTLF